MPILKPPVYLDRLEAAKPAGSRLSRRAAGPLNGNGGTMAAKCEALRELPLKAR